MASLKEYLLRIKQTSAGELVHRGRRLLLAARVKRAALEKRPFVAVPTVDRARIDCLTMPRLVVEKDRPIPDMPSVEDPVTLTPSHALIRQFEKDCSGLFFSDVESRCGTIDIRSVWEPARLQRVTQCLLRANTVSDPAQKNSILVEARQTVLQWIADNPFLLGPHYMSPMECGLRVPVFFYCLKSIQDLQLHEYDSIADTLYQHAWWVYRNLSIFNSLGNHTICECVGLVVAGAVYRGTMEGKKWLARGCRLMDQEINHQILPDGGPAEQSPNYHRFILDLFWLAFDFLRVNGLYDCSAWQPPLEAGESYLAALTTHASRYVSLGDSDDGYAVAPGVAPLRNHPRQTLGNQHTFDASGLTVMRGEDWLFTFDHGPLGMAPLYNHGHADALSFTLTYRGQPVFIDPGTYRYNNVPQWRRYFKGTRAHNTVTVDNTDQAQQVSGFVWTNPYPCMVLEHTTSRMNVSIEAVHDGYYRLDQPVRHLRRITHWTPDAFLVQDRFSGIGRHEYELNFHLGKAEAITRINRWWCLDFGSFRVFLKIFEPVEGRLVEGQTDPPFGWQSPAYGVRRPSRVITFRRSGLTHEITFTTAILVKATDQELKHAATA